jgi:hypothetical protein
MCCPSGSTEVLNEVPPLEKRLPQGFAPQLVGWLVGSCCSHCVTRSKGGCSTSSETTAQWLVAIASWSAVWQCIEGQAEEAEKAVAVAVEEVGQGWWVRWAAVEEGQLLLLQHLPQQPLQGGHLGGEYIHLAIESFHLRYDVIMLLMKGFNVNLAPMV